MTTLETRQDNWKECVPGTLGHYANRQRTLTLKRRLLGVGGVASICLLALLAWNGFLHQTTVQSNTKASTEPNYGGIVCSSVKTVARAHMAGTLDAETTQKIELHLQECPACRSFMEQLGNVQANKTSFHTHRERNVSVTTARARLTDRSD